MPDTASRRPLAVLFDLDGTLVDTIQLLLESVRHAFRTRAASGGRVPTEGEWIAGIGTPLVEQLRPYATSDDDMTELVAGYRAYQVEHHDRLTRCYDRAVDVVTTLKRRGHPTAVVTSKADAIARRTLAHVGLLDAMDLVVGVEATQRHKPDPAPVRFALDRLGYSPADAVFLGDSPHDVAAGNAAGVVTVAALWGPFDRTTLAAVRPTHFLSDIGELPPLIERLEGRV